MDIVSSKDNPIRFSISMPKRLQQKADKEAKARDMSLSRLISNAVAAYIAPETTAAEVK